MTHKKPLIEVAALTIAGSDSCGGAGIQADLKTFQALGVYGASVITAVTAQNTRAVAAAEPISPDLITAQIEAVLEDLPVRAVKTGMLPDAATVEAICEVLEPRQGEFSLVVDPVLVATSGAALTLEDTIAALKQRLFPLADLVTPNLAEARALAGSDEDAARAASELLELGCGAVLLKGGHLEGETIVDRLVRANGQRSFEHPNTPGEYHGTGCCLSAAITALMARGSDLEAAVRQGIDHVQNLIANARRPLRGQLYLLN